jgi:hypothetical protein
MRTALRSVPLAIAPFVLLAACGGEPGRSGTTGQGGATPVALAPAEARAVQYILANTTPGVPYELNLADPQQHAYVVETLRRHGRTPERMPQLYRLLEAARRGTAGPARVATGLDADSAAVLGGVNYTTEFGQDSVGGYYSNAFSSYPATEIPHNTQVLSSLIDRRSNTVIASGDTSVFVQTNVQVPVQGMPPDSARNIVSNTLFLVAPSDTSLLKAYSVVLSDFAAVTAACQLSPSYSTSGVQQCQTSGSTTCVNNGAITRAVKVCYGPRIQNDCDYGCQGSGYPPNIIFPIVGSANLGQTPVSPPTGSLYIVLRDVAGGGCVLNATQNKVGSLQGLVTVTGTTAAWNLAPGSFPNQNCLQPNGMLMNYSFQLYMQTATGSVGLTFTSDTSQARLPNTYMVPQIDVVEGCLPDGTLIRMADGSQRVVESFQGYGNERVRSRGGDRAVLATTWGHEDRPLVALRDDRGHALLLTEWHPVMTPRGAVAALHLKAGDTVLTEGGEARLVEVSRRTSPRAVPVHNLRVGTEEQARRGENTFYANGILVGDQLTQRQVHLAARTAPRLSHDEVLARLPAEWRQDYLNSRKP